MGMGMRVNSTAHERQLRMTKFKGRVLELCQEPELDLDDDEFVAALADLTSSMLQRSINKKHNLRSPGE